MEEENNSGLADRLLQKLKERELKEAEARRSSPQPPKPKVSPAEQKLAEDVIKEYEARVERRSTGRKLKNWIASYLDLTSKHEAPEIFHFWTALSLLASALGRHAKLHFAFYDIYPNLYIALIATSAECRKSTAVDFAESIAREIPSVYIIKDKLTPEGLLQRMSTNIDANIMAQHHVVKADGSVYMMLEELSVCFSSVTYVSGLVEVLTALYIPKDRFQYTTRHAPIEIYNTCVNVLGASTPEWLSRGMPDLHASGGFLGRFIFIVAHKPKTKRAFLVRTPAFEDLRASLIQDLQQITQVSGEFALDDEAKAVYEEWYNEYAVVADPRLKEYSGRKDATVLKLAMLFSVAESSTLLIKAKHIKAALRALEIAEMDMVDAFIYLGSTAESQIGRAVLQLLAQGELTKPALLRAVSYRVRKVSDFDAIVAMLEQEERIISVRTPGGPASYRLATEEEKRRADETKRRMAGVKANLFSPAGDLIV